MIKNSLKLSLFFLLLMGGLFLAVGIFASSCTRHQLLAAMISIAVRSLAEPEKTAITTRWRWRFYAYGLLAGAMKA